jgi:hypothetical protein
MDKHDIEIDEALGYAIFMTLSEAEGNGTISSEVKMALLARCDEINNALLQGKRFVVSNDPANGKPFTITETPLAADQIEADEDPSTLIIR